MNELKTFKSIEFGQLRSVEIKGKIYFAGKDAANALGYNNPRDAIIRYCKGVMRYDSFKEDGQEIDLISESDMYRLITHSKMESAQRYETWVFDDVMPFVRQTSSYQQRPLSQLEILQMSIGMLSQHEQVMEQIDNRMSKLEFDIPLYGSEADELSSHVRRKGIQVLGGKQSEAYKDAEVRSKVYREIYDQIKQEFDIYDDSGKPKSYRGLKRKYIADAHKLIDCYEVTEDLAELIENANDQIDKSAVTVEA